MKTVLIVAGSDSGGGAGIQADLAACHNLGVWGTTAITCLTAQNPREVTRVEPATPEMVAEQIAAVCRCFPVATVKIGMTYSEPIIVAIATALTNHAPTVPIVLDPVMRAGSGASLLQPGGEKALVEHLLARAAVVTPNLPEAAVLAHCGEICTLAQMETAARRIAERTPAMVIVKGGHLSEAATDIVLLDEQVTRLESHRIDAGSTHGTGCSFASAIAASMALGLDRLAAALRAKEYVTALLEWRIPLGENLSGLGLVSRKGVFELWRDSD